MKYILIIALIYFIYIFVVLHIRHLKKMALLKKEIAVKQSELFELNFKKGRIEREILLKEQDNVKNNYPALDFNDNDEEYEHQLYKENINFSKFLNVRNEHFNKIIKTKNITDLDINKKYAILTKFAMWAKTEYAYRKYIAYQVGVTGKEFNKNDVDKFVKKIKATKIHPRLQAMDTIAMHSIWKQVLNKK